MARNKNGHQNGKLGSTVTYWLKGQEVTRYIGKTHKEPTIKQLNVRLRTKMMAKFLAVANQYLKVGFYAGAKLFNKEPQNLAFAYNWHHALKGEYPDISIDYPNVLLSQGDLPIPVDAKAEAVDGKLKITWDTSSEILHSFSHDRVLIFAYIPGVDEAFMSQTLTRTDGTEIFNLPKSMKGLPIETYISFASWDLKKTSNSVYLGQVTP